MILLFAIITEIIADFIYPDRANPIVPYRNNEDAYTFYDIFLSVSTRISSNGRLQITFPQEFDGTQLRLLQDDVMAATNIDKECYIEYTFSTTTTCIPYVEPAVTIPATNYYTISNRTITIFFGSEPLNAGSQKVRIKYNKNPVGLGGKSSGYLQIITLRDTVPVDQNLNFGTVGFAPVYKKHTIASEGQIINDGSKLGGYVTNYVIQFTTTIDLIKGSWFRAEIAEGFDISNVECVLVDTLQNLNCQVEGRRIYFSAIDAALPKGQHKVKLKNVINPSASGDSDPFIFETLEPLVNTVIEYFNVGVTTITPGQIINPSIAGAPLNQNLRIDYTIKFTPQNKIPYTGKIDYIIPAGFTLDPTCRIISGLSQNGTTPISCVTSGQNITITNFASFSPQEITLKIYAVNPPISKLYQYCQIYTYSTFGKVPVISGSSSNYKGIDQNIEAGSIQISSIQSPYFVAIDLYKQMQNISLDKTGPLDFRLYPMPSNQLKLTTSPTSYGSIYFQIPLWWRMSGQYFNGWNVVGSTPTCNFGAEIAATCNYYLQRFSFKTPTSTNYLKYDPNTGLGNCDLPISVAVSQITPIPGRFDFRVLTFNDGVYSTFDKTPLEQDLYTMEIAADQFIAPNTYIKCTSVDQVDADMVCYSNVVVLLPIPYEGAINFNMSTVNSTYESSAAWPNDLGFGLGNDAKKRIPCYVSIRTSHPNVQCWVFSGGITRKYAILQVRGFSSKVNTGSNVFVVIPNVKSCTAYDMQCFVTVSSAWTTELDEPYTMNYLKQSVGFIKQGDVYKDVSVNPPTLAKDVQDLTLSATFLSTKQQICELTTWTLQFQHTEVITACSTGTTNYPYCANQTPDHILIKFTDKTRFPNQFGVTATSPQGAVYLIDHFLTGEYYYFIIVNSGNVAANGPVQLSNIYNPIIYTPGIDIKLIFWNQNRKIKRITFPTSNIFIDGGILGPPQFDILPKTAVGMNADRSQVVDMDFDSWIIFRATFTTCHKIPANGLVELEVQNGLVDYTTTCEVWSGVTSPPKRLGHTHECNLVDVSGIKYYQLTKFNEIPVLTKFTLSFRGKTGLASTTANPIRIQTYFDATVPTSTASNVDNFYNTAYPPNPVLNGIDITGPKRFPPKLEWMDFIIINDKAREGTRGEFYMHVKTNHNIPDYTTNTAPRLVFTFNTTAVSMPLGAYPHCRLDGHLARFCDWAGGVITMAMPLTQGMIANQEHLVMISTRGADYSSTYQEGLHHNKAGTYKLKIETVNTGTNQFIRKVMTIDPPKFRVFWVWSANKVGYDPVTPSATLQGMSVFRLYFTNTITIPPSDNPDPISIIVLFHRTIWPTFTNGFEQDLGTGLPHRTQLPCIQDGFTLLPGVTQLKCRLFYGSYPNPTKVIITDFDQINVNTNGEIHLPNIFNPNSTYELTKITLQVQKTDAITGTSELILSSDYDLINGTFGRTKEQPGFNQLAVDIPALVLDDLQNVWAAAVNPTFSVATIDTVATLSLQYGSKDYNMGGGADMILFEIPPNWDLPYGLITCSFPAGNICYSYPLGPYIGLYPDNGITADTLQSGSVTIKTPPFKVLVATSDPPIKIYVFTRSKLVYVYKIDFTQVLNAVAVTPAVTCTLCFYEAITDYTITVTNPKNIPTTGAITIKIPTGLTIRENGCRNDVASGSVLSKVGFECAYDGANSQLLITGFNKFIGPGKIIIKVRMENPDNTVTISEKWDFKTWYLNESPLNKLITYGDTTTPALTTSTNIEYWDTPYRSRVRGRTTLYGSIEFRINLQNDLAAGDILYIKFPTLFNKVRCSQYLCLWDDSPWFDNHNDNFLPAEKCLYDKTTRILSMYTPLSTKIKKDTVYRVIIDTQNSADGSRGFQLPAMNTYTFDVYTTLELKHSDIFVPQQQAFKYFECVSLITNVKSKNMMVVRFNPVNNIPISAGTFGGGYLKLYFPTLSEESEFLYQDDLGTGKKDGDSIQCYARNGFPPSTVLDCRIYLGNRVYGQPAYILIQGWIGLLKTDPSFTSGYQELFSRVISPPFTGTDKYFEFDIDQFYTPDVIGDDKHIEMRLESYDGATNSLIDQSFSYDMTLKHYTPATGTLPKPTKSSDTLFDQSVTFDLKMQSSIQLKNSEEYDFFIFEYTQPYFDPQPQNIQCESGSVYVCRVSQGNNWIVVKPLSTIQAQASLKFKNSNNPIQVPTTGIVCTAYAVKDRIITTIYTYAAINDYLLPTLAATAYNTIVTPIDYADNTTIPKSTEIRVRVEITIPTQSITLPYGSIIDIFLPTGFTAYDYSLSTSDSNAKFVTADNLQTSVIASSAITGFTGRPQLTITGWEPIKVGEKIIFETYCKTSSAALSPALWNFKAWKDTGRTIELWTSAASAFNVQSYASFKTLDWKTKDPTVARKNQISPFTFHLSFKTTPTANTKITVSFPALASVSVPAGAVLYCTIEGTTGLVHKFSYCYGTNSLDVIMLMPVSPVTFAASIQYKVTISSRGNSINHGLMFGASGVFTATLTQDNGDTGSLRFEILPTDQFTSTQLRIVNSGIQSTGYTETALLFSFTTSVPILKTGKIVIAFPNYAIDGTTTLFQENLIQSSVYNSGDLYPGCYSTNSALYNNGLNCRIFKNSGEFFQTLIVIQGFTSDILNGANLQIVIEQVTLPTSAASADVFLYTADVNNNKLEAYYFEDAVTSLVLGLSTMTTTVVPTGATVQGSTLLTFSGLNFGGTVFDGYSHIAYRFPVGYYDISSATVTTGGTCTTPSVLEIYAHWIIQRFTGLTACSGSQNVVLANINQVNSVVTTASNLAFQVYTCLTRVCDYYIPATNPSITYTAASAGSLQVAEPTAVRYFPYSFYKFELVYTCGHNIPMGGQLILDTDATKFSVQRIELKSGGITSVTYANAAGSITTFTLLSSYLKTQATIKFDVYGYLPSTIGASGAITFKFSLKNRYNGYEISSDSLLPSWDVKTPVSIVSSQSFSSVSSSQSILSIMLLPGVKSVDNELHFQLPSISTSDTTNFKVYVFIEGMISGSGSCSISIAEGSSAGTPLCNVAGADKLEITGIDPSTIKQEFYLLVKYVKITTYGLLPVTIQLLNNNGDVINIFTGSVIVYEQQMESLGASFKHKTNGGGSNILEISFDPPAITNFNGFDGELFLDLLGSFVSLPSAIIKEQCDYASALNSDCEFVPAFRLNSVGSATAHRDPFNNRIVISKFEQQSTSINNIKIWFQYQYSAPTYWITTKMFQFGYYIKGQGNNQIYKCGYNFLLTLFELDSSAPLSNSGSLNHIGSAQSIGTITSSTIMTQQSSSSFTDNDYFTIKLIGGYSVKYGTYNQMKMLSSTATISSSSTATTLDNSYTIQRMGYFEGKMSSSSSDIAFTLSNIELPYYPTSSLTDIAAIVLILDGSSRQIKEKILLTRSTSASSQSFTTCSAQQIDSNSFQFSFTLPSNFKTFNHNGCVSTSTCFQYIEITTTNSAYNDIWQYEVTCGSGSSLINQYIPYEGYPPKLSQITSNPYGMRLSEYLEMNSNSQICIKFRKKTVAAAGSLQFTITIYENQSSPIAIASCTTASITTSNTASGHQLSGVVKQPFGLQLFYDNFKALVKNVERQITIEFSLLADLSSSGTFTIESGNLGLGNFDVTKRLKCMFKEKATQLVKHVPSLCVVDTTNKKITITYNITTLTTLNPKLVKDKVYELIIKYDQNSLKFLSEPAFQGQHQLKFKFFVGATLTYSQVLPFTIYNNQVSDLVTQSYVDHISEQTNFYVKYKTTQSLASSDYIDVLIPIRAVQSDGSLKILNTNNLNTAILNGQKIGCLDKVGNLGLYFKCYLYYGIADFQKPHSFIRLTNFTGLGSGTTVQFVIQNLKNPSTTDLIMDYEIRISGADSYEYTYAYAATYTLPASSATSSTTGTLTITPLPCFSQINYQYQVTLSKDVDPNYESIVKISYDPLIWGEDYTIFAATIGGTASRIDSLDSQNVFIVFPAGYSTGTSITIAITNGLIQPSYVLTKSHAVTASFINYQTKAIVQVATTTTSVTTTQSNIANYGTVSSNSDLMKDILSVMLIPLTLLGPVKTNYQFRIIFPTDYILSAGYCKIFDDLTNVEYSTTCSDIDAQTKKIIFNTPIKATKAITVKVQVQTPTTAGSKSITVKFFADNLDTSTLLIQSDTLAAQTIINFTKMRLAMPYIKAPQILLQDGEIGPITLTVKLTSAITKQTDTVVIDTNNFMTVTIQQPINTKRLQFACFWNNLAAMNCRNGDTSANYDKITMYAPSDTGFASGDIVTVKIMVWRHQEIGQTDFTYQWHDNTDDSVPIANIKDKKITIGTTDYQKYVTYQNYRFDETTVPTYQTYVAVHQGTIDTQTDLTVSFRLRRTLSSNLNTNWGQIILKLPTMDDDNLQSQFPNGLGRFTKNAQEIDCFCSTCPQISNIDPLEPFFKCYVYQGSSHRVAPVEIWLNPQQDMVAQQIVEISFPKIKLPSTSYTYGKISMLAYEYQASTKTTRNHSEIVHFYTYHTIPDAFTTYTAVTPPTFTVNMVGAMSGVTATVNNPYDDLLDYCHDRWVLSTDDAETIFEHPYNPETGTLYSNGGAYPYNYIEYTTATNHIVVIYKLAKWITFVPKVVLTKSATQTLNIQKFKNMPYKIPSGVNYKMTLFIDIGVRSYTEYSVFTTATQYRLAYQPSTTVKQMSIDPIPAPAETAAPQTYELKFLPYNKIPKNGKIIFTFPPLPSYDWVFTDQYCTVSQNLQDSGCDIIPASRIIIIKDWLNDYDPNIDGYLSVKFDIVNPTNVQTQVPFTWRTYWDQNQNTWLIDEETFFENTPTTQIIQGGNLIVTLWERYQHPYIICGGRKGPIRLRFILRDQNLVYPNDYIELWMQNTFWPVSTQKYIVCYFNDPNDFQLVNIKSHRCDWTAGVNGGTLQVYIPEEIDIHVGDEWELVITTFGQFGGDGWVVRSPSDLNWITFFAMKNGVNTIDKGWFEAQIPGCPFDNFGFDCQSVGWEASTVGGDPTWTILNFTAQTETNAIPAGDPSLLTYSRLVFEFITHNELQESWPMDLTNRMAATDDRAQVACNGMYKTNGANRPLQPKGNTYIECYNIKAENKVWNNTPSYIVGSYFDAIAAQERFHFQIADFRNGYVQGAFQHVKISVEVIQEDGTFYPQNEHYCWHLPPSLYPPPSPSTASTSTWAIQRSQVALSQQQSYFGDVNVEWFDTIVYDFNYPYTLPMKGYCLQRRYNANFSDGYLSPCTPQHFNHWWVMSAAIQDPTIKWYQRESGNFINPPFVYKQNNPTNDPTINNNIAQASPLRIYIWRNNQLISNQTFQLNGGKISPTTGQLFIVSQTTTNDNAKNTMVRHHMGIHFQTTTSAMKYIRLWAPNDYQNIQDCKVNRGLVSRDPADLDNKITCVITKLPAPIDKWLIEIDNFQTYQGHGEDQWMIIDFNLTNPNSEKWTGSWYGKTYESSTNLSYVIDESKGTDGQTWVGESVKQPNLFRVWRNTISYENRRAQTDDYAEVHMRVLPRTSHPATTDNSNTQVQIWLPLAYDLANGGDALCQISNEYHSDLDSVNCKITSDRKITLSTDNTYGLKQECSMVTVTTQNAIGGNGIKLPSTPQDDTFQVFIDSTDSTGNVQREYNYNQAYAVPDPITSATDPTFSIKSTIREANQYTVIKATFTAPLDIPAGYDTSSPGQDPLSAPPIGTLRYKFNTKDFVNSGYPGFPLNLGQSSTNVLCQGFGNLKGTLQCTLIASSQQSPDYPAIIEVRGFDYISQGDLVEVHFLNIQNGQYYQNKGNVTLSAYKKKGDGTKVELIQDSTGFVPVYDPNCYGNLCYTVFTTCPTSAQIAMDPNVVGAYMQVTINPISINCTTPATTYQPLQAGDQVILTFPVEFEFPSESNGAISALWNQIQMSTIVYPLTREIYFTFPTGTTITGCTNTLKISQLRGPAYEFSTAYNIRMRIVKSQYRRVDCIISGITPPNVATPSTQSMLLSSYFAGDIFVDYDFKFSPSYKIPAGGTIDITFPNRGLLNYNHVTSSTPPAVCSLLNSVYITSCVLSTTGVQVTVAQDIPAQQELEIKLSGVKNSDYAGQTLASDYVLTMYHPNGEKVNEIGFSPFQFYAKKNVGVIYMKLSNTNNFQSVTASYTFVIQNSYRVPASGEIVLKMPKEWASVVTNSITLAKLSASWTSDALSYTYSIDSSTDINNYLLRIKNQFTWPQGGSLTLLMLKLKNPSFESTKIFQAQTYYDNVLLDQTDPLDSSLKFTYKPAVPSLTINNFIMEPANAGEVSTYSLNMTSSGNMTSGSTIQIQFPTDTYPPGLTRYDLSLGCNLHFKNGTNVTVPCSAANSKLTVSLNANIDQNTEFTLSVVGITNPNYDTGAIKGSIDVLTTDSNNNVLTYNSGAAEINPTAAPQTMKLVKLATSSTNLQVKAAYTLCVQTDISIPLGAQVFVDFPQQFTFKSSSYPCYISLDHNNALLPYDNSTSSPSCKNSNSLRRIAISGHTAAYVGNKNSPAQLCYILDNIENPSSAGPTDNFVVSIYDTQNKNVVAQTFGTLSPNSTLSYSQQGLVITVESIDPLPRYLTTKPIKVTLQRSVSHTVTLTPQSTEFKFIPPELVFLPSNGPEMYFKIQAINDDATDVGLKQFSWLKVESATAKFSEMADSFFQYVDKPTANQLYMTINPRVFRVALGGTSLPMTLTLSQPAAQDLLVNFTTINPYQDSSLVFEPINAAGQVKFPAGTTSIQLQYTTKQTALSGQIQFEIVDKYSSLYTILDNIVNFEILETDDKIPEVVNYYAVNVKRTSMYFRASIDESVTLYYYLTLKGNPKPTMEQIKSQQKLTNVFTQFGNNQSFIAPVTSDYIYNDVYLDLQGLTEQTDYSLYFFVTDLSGNNNTEVKQFDFTTAAKYQPAQFKITLGKDVDIDKLLSAFGLVTGLPSSSFQTIEKPKKFTIDGELDSDVQSIIDSQTVTYTFQINPDATVGGLSPYEYIRLIQQNLDLLQSEIPEVVDQNIFNTAWEYFEYPQEFKYTPIKINVTEDAVYFNVSLRYTGNLYTLVLPADSPAPSSKQVSMGLNSTNSPVQKEWVYQIRFEYSNKTSTDDQKLYAIFNYTLLFDNSYYKAYFTADNNLVSNPDLMTNEQMKQIEFKTKREIVIIPKKYLQSSLLSILMIIILCIG
ncbi:unnamed protein product [Paramecium octaurelia]|uniref:Uncharacterized protein n=1 Tax=Paramecium octaurelia TaxID=43137 RepID=A0A8S1SHE7_PAROT|nr:unnamed protein product [Paramecium octaurelia]